MELPGLDASFELGPELGRGGFGVVYAATRRADRAAAVVKLPLADLPVDARERVAREAALMARIEHPRLARFLGLYRAGDGRPALAYARVRGEPLGAVLGAEPMALEPALGLVTDLAGALDALAGAGLVHRDLKAGNVMVGPDGRATLIDYGLLRPIAAGATVTADGLMVGTPETLAPELLAGSRADARADLYGLGCVAYRLLAGRYPFEGGLDAIIRGHLRGRVPPLPAPPGTPALDAAFVRILAKDPAARPGSGRELVAALAVGKGPGTREVHTVVLAGPPRPAEPSTPVPHRGRSPAWVGIAAGAGLLALGAVLGRGTGSSPLPRAAGDEFPGEGFAARVEAELGEARGVEVEIGGEALRLLHPDPLRWGAVLERIPGLARFYAWLAAGGRPEGIPEGCRAELRGLGGRLAGSGGLSDPFEPFLEAAPATGPVSLPDLASRLALVGLPAAPQGFTGAALARFEQALKAVWRVEAALRGPATGLATWDVEPGWLTAAARPGREIRLEDLVEYCMRDRSRRTRVRHLLSRLGAEFAAAFYLAGRAVEAEPERADDLAAFFASDLRLPRWVLAGIWPVVPVEAVVGGSLEVPARALLAACLVRSHLANRWGPWYREFEPRSLDLEALLARAASLGPGDGPSARRRAAWARCRLGQVLIRVGSFGRAAAHFESELARPEPEAADAVLALAVEAINRWDDFRPRPEWSPDLMRRLAERVRDAPPELKARFPDPSAFARLDEDLAPWLAPR